MNAINRGPLGSAFLVGREPATPPAPTPAPAPVAEPEHPPIPTPRSSYISNELTRSLSEVKGQAQFLLYLADQIEDSLHQLTSEQDPGHAAFLGNVLGMYYA